VVHELEPKLKHMKFHSENKFEKLVHLVGLLSEMSTVLVHQYALKTF